MQSVADLMVQSSSSSGVANGEGTERFANVARVNIGKGKAAGGKQGGKAKENTWSMIQCSLHWYLIICIFESMWKL